MADPVTSALVPERVVPGYTPHDVERWVPEPAKDPERGAFARDRARVVHSSALRRLAAKTQVVDPDADDFVRNRLTHSLEVAQVGRELGLALGCDPDIVDTACLAHDLGHPPFGHNGESVLDEIAWQIGGFEGNAQSLRVLTRLEPKVFAAANGPLAGRCVGLNLTRAGLDACTKYPWLRGGNPFSPSKFGAYLDDAAVFDWLRTGAPAGRRCLEAQVMDLADDIAYSVHDIEDAVVGGYLDPADLADPGRVTPVEAVAAAQYLRDAEPGEIAAALDRLRALPGWVGHYDGGRRALGALKDLTSQLIGRFARDVEQATRGRHGEGELRRYGADLIVPRETLTEIAALKSVAAVYVMRVDSRRPLYQRQRDLLLELHDAVLRGAPATLEPPFAADWSAAPDDAARRRVVVDQLASLTDPSAVAWHRRLCRSER